MTRREKILASTLLAVLLVFGGGLLFHVFVYEPMTTVRGQLEAERDALVDRENALAQERQRIDAILKVNPRLTQWAQISLPPRDPELRKARLPLEEQNRKHLANLRVAYEAYLSGLMEAAGFRRGTVKVEVRQSARAPGLTGKEKQAPYEQLTFGVVGEGNMESVARVMRDLYRTPLLHHVRGLTLALPPEQGGRRPGPPGQLKMDLTVDALAVVGGEERTDLMPKKLAYPPPVLAEPSRDYLVLERVNPFTGLKKDDGDSAAAVPTEEKREVLRFVKVTGLQTDDRGRMEATLYDQAKGGREKRLNTGSRDEFTIYDKNENPVFEAKVVQVTAEHLLIQSGGKFYELHSGDFLYPAVTRPVSRSRLRELGVRPEGDEKPRRRQR